jgi:hypothetical protein
MSAGGRRHALGTCGLPESKLRELALEASAGSRWNPFNNLYEVTP